MNISDLVPWKSRTPAGRDDEDPFYEMRREMNRLFGDFMTGLEPAFGERAGTFYPSINLIESDTELTVTAELPGMSEADIDITLAGDTLRIEGEKKAETEDEGKSYYRRERTYGFFERTIPLPSDVINSDKVEASFENGVLTVTLPKREDVQAVAKRIPVKTA